MHLSKLKLKGFKSFADTAELDLSDGISAIVGPNGSGKSNITDAIRWVLGEQSTKALRGKKMEDVIFAGTEQKSPLGYAEVTLILDNADGALKDYPEELQVMRRLFRTGESEYRLNNQNCKLKDIQQIFTDTGLGKNGYSLISQGAIEDIINAGPMELRSIVEEAVGIVSYKNRKLEAERKLQRTRDNLDRVGDIFKELEKRREPLKRQAKKAKEFIAVHEELKMIDLLRFTERMDEIEKERAKVDREMMDLRAEINRLQQDLNKDDALYQKKQAELQQMIQVIEEKNADRKALETLHHDSQSKLLVAEERLRHLSDAQDRLIGEIEKVSEALQRLETEKNRRLQAINSLEDALSDIEAKIQNLMQEQDLIRIQTEAIRLQREKNTKQEEKAALEHQQLQEKIQKKKEWLSGEAVRYDLAQETYKGLQKEWQSFNDERLQMRRVVEEGQKVLQGLRSSLEQQGAQKTALEQALQQNQQKLNVINNNMRVNMKQRDYLHRIQENYSDYYPSIQKIMTASAFQETERKKIFGPVGELITVPDIYAKAIEVALGGKTQYIVVETVAAASRCIDFLKAQKAGRITFLPLDNLRYHGVEERDRYLLSKMKGFVGVASELVTYPIRFRSAVESLLSRILVAKDFQSAGDISRSIKKYTIVTLEGEIFYVGGAIVGGVGKGSKQAPFMKKIEIDRLVKEYQEAEAEKKYLEQQRDEKMIRFSTLAEALKKEKEAVGEKEKALWQDRHQLEVLEQSVDETSTRMTGIEQEQIQRRNELENKKQEVAILENRLSETAERPKHHLEEEPNQELNEKKEALEQDLTALKIEKARKTEQCLAAQKDFSKLKGELVSTQDHLARLREEKLRIESERGQLQLEMREYEKHLISTDWDREEREKEERRLNINREKLNEEIMAISRDIQNGNHDLMVQKDAENKAALVSDRLNNEKEHLEEGIYSRYEMTLLMAKDAVKAAVVLPEDYSETRQRALRRQLNGLGQVNLSAVEEFAEVEQRYNFMKTQIDDLKGAEKELKKIIQNLYLSMEHQFSEGFKQLQVIFSEVFAVLFEGGKAQLSYSDPDHILESGIDLTAQPPGKRLKHISLLSGGETSMTAIALLFSFLRLNPSPFCVIDEIDAALDDRNIQRFTNYMRSLSDDIKFMLITHRKKTLEVCDAIYGVTMSKTGISKLISIRLSDYMEEES